MEKRDIFLVSKKIKKVIDSCTIKEHFNVAENMISNFHRTYEDDPDEPNCTDSLLLYLKLKRC